MPVTSCFFGEVEDCELVLNEFLKRVYSDNDQKLSRKKILSALYASQKQKPVDLNQRLEAELKLCSGGKYIPRQEFQ